MIFSQLYGIELDRELGSTDTTLFTTARRKAAINAGQLEWVKRTECFILESTIALITDTQEFDLEATITDIAWISKQGVSIKIVNGSTTRYIQGDDLRVTTIERLNQEEPGWRAVDAATPMFQWVRRNGGALSLGFYPKPKITSPEVWTAIIPYVILPADMSADSDEPFTVSVNPVRSLRPWHRALVHYGAYDLEKFRKDEARASAQLQLFELEVAKFTGVEKPKGGSTVRMTRNYRREASRGSQRLQDPRIC